MVDEKSKEISAVQALIATLGLSGRVFTLDVMHCQKKTFEPPATPAMSRTASRACCVASKTSPQQQRRSPSTTVAIFARNRQEDRCVAVYLPGSALDETEWASLVAAVVRVTHPPSCCPPRPSPPPSAITGRSACPEGHLCLKSTDQNQNQNHWVRDVTLTEDASRIRVNPGIMARLRSQTLNISRQLNLALPPQPPPRITAARRIAPAPAPRNVVETF